MWTEEKLDHLLSTPSTALIADVSKIKGDIMVLGAGGKMGPSLCLLAKRALLAANCKNELIAVSRFTDEMSKEMLLKQGISVISADLQDWAQLQKLPKASNIIYMAGRKFGTDGDEWRTWGMNATLPVFVAEAFRCSNIVVFSSGNVYPLTPIHAGGCKEEDSAQPIGEYAMSCLARERAFEYAANTYGTKILINRLSFAVDLRYGVLYDIASHVLHNEPISVTTPMINCIWQGSANEVAIRSLLHASSPACVLNVTGPEFVSVRAAAIRFGELFGKKPAFTGIEQGDAYLSNAAKVTTLFGYPTVSAAQMIHWQAEWMLTGGRTLNKPTHFEERGGVY